MQANALRRVVYRTLGIPNPADPPPTNPEAACIEAGTFQPADSREAVEAVTGRFVQFVRELYTVFPPAEVAPLDFLSFPEYREAVAHIADLRERFEGREGARRRELLEARREGLERRRQAVAEIEEERQAAHVAAIERQRQANEYRREQLDHMAAYADQQAEERQEREEWREERQRQLAAHRAERRRQLATWKAERQQQMAAYRAEERQQMATYRAEERQQMATYRAEQRQDAQRNAVARLDDQRAAIEDDENTVWDRIEWLEGRRWLVDWRERQRNDQELDRLDEKVRKLEQKHRLISEEMARQQDTQSRDFPKINHRQQLKPPPLIEPLPLDPPDIEIMPAPRQTSRGELYRQLAEILPDPAETPYVDSTPTILAQIDSETDIINRQLAHLDDDLTIPPHEEKKRAFVALYSPDYFRSDIDGYLAYLRAVCLETGIPLSAFFYLRLPYLLPERERQKHTYILGQTGSGKSELLKSLIYSYVKEPADSPCIIIIDPKGDFADQVARWPEVANTGRLVYIRPDPKHNLCPTLNPFDLKDKTTHAAEIAANQFAAVFEELIRRDGGDLSLHMNALLVPCLTTLFRLQNTSLETLKEFLDDTRNQKLIECGLRSSNPSHRDFFENDFRSPAYKKTKEALTVRVQRILNTSVLRRLLVGQSTIDLDQATRERKVIVFSLPKGDIGPDTVLTFGTFVVAMLQAIVIRRAPHERVPCHFFIDEFQNFITPSISTILDESGRSFRLHLTLAQHYIGQKANDKATDISDSLCQNTTVHFIGRGNNEKIMKNGKLLGINSDDLDAFTKRKAVGKFLVHISGNQATTTITIPDSLVDNRHGIPAEAWRAVLAEQHRNYGPITGDDTAAPVYAAEGAGNTTARQAPPATHLEFE